jgi:hypothetical protein
MSGPGPSKGCEGRWDTFLVPGGAEALGSPPRFVDPGRFRSGIALPRWRALSRHHLRAVLLASLRTPLSRS